MYSKEKLCAIAETEAKKNLVWTPGAEATKFTKFYEPTFGKARFSWCAAFVTWCLHEAGLNVPVKNPSAFGFTFAYVPAWHAWAEAQGFFHLNDGSFKPQAGDIVIYDWDQKAIGHDDLTDNHIGIHLRMNGHLFEAAEGNTSNMTAVRARDGKFIKGWISIPEDFSFGGAAQPIVTASGTPVYGNDDAFVRAFQLKAKLPVDGDAGPQTYAALEKLSVG